MFGGIVQEIAKIHSFTKREIVALVVKSQMIQACSIGDSIAINGVCLTIVELDKLKGFVAFDVVPETLRKTTLDDLIVGKEVNFELALRLNDFIGGHTVQGHIDGVGEIKNIEYESDAWLVSIAASTQILKYIVDKGFITIDGMSITVIKTTDNFFTVTFIPHTINTSIVKNYKIGTKVNLEVDLIGKHVYNYMEKMRSVAKN